MADTAPLSPDCGGSNFNSSFRMSSGSSGSGYRGLSGDNTTQWGALKPDVHTEKELVIQGHPVMQKWEEAYMEELANVAALNGGRVLEVGFGLGLSARAIQSHSNVTEHIIIEANEDVFRRLQSFAKEEGRQRKVTPMLGLWQEVVKEIPDDSLDGVLYDTYPLSDKEQHTHQFPFLREAFRMLKPGGVLTYCNLTSLGVLKGEYENWKDLWEATQVPHLRETGGWCIGEFRLISVAPPATCRYYQHREALVPTLYKPSP